MKTGKEKRNDKRSSKSIPIMLEYKTGSYCSAVMQNYSSGGMYLETDCSPDTGTKIYIGIEKSPYELCPAVYSARVVWCDEIQDDEAIYLYGMGVKLNGHC